MLVRQVTTRLIRNRERSRKFGECLSRGASTSSDDVPERPERKLQEWRKWPEPEPTFLHMFNRKQPKGKKYVLPTPFTFELSKWWTMHKNNFVKYDQRFTEERHKTLGCDLAAGHYLVSRGGKVKYQDQDEWIAKNEEGGYRLPERYDAKWRLTHLDASDLSLYYEGVDNFRDLAKVGWANFSGNPHLDDWCVDIVCANFRNVEYLDISRCPKVTERCFDAIYKLFDLKTLVVTDWRKDATFELAVVMLEDCMPDLTIRIAEPPN